MSTNKNKNKNKNKVKMKPMNFHRQPKESTRPESLITTNKIEPSLDMDRALVALVQKAYTNIKDHGDRRFSQDDPSLGIDITELFQTAEEDHTPGVIDEHQ